MFNLNLTDVKEQSFDLVPVGEYTMFSLEAQVKSTKSGTGEYINVKFKITNGDQDGRFLFHSFNIKNDNQKAVEIGLGQLKTFMKCAGIKDLNKLTDVNDLCGHSVVGVVKHKKSEGYDDRAEISYFKPYTGVKTNTVAKSDIPF